MVTEPTGLDELLASLFDNGTLRRFVYKLPHGDKLLSELPGSNTPIAILALATARLLTQYGMVDTALTHLMQARPNRRSDIERLRARFETETKPCPSADARGIAANLLPTSSSKWKSAQNRARRNQHCYIDARIVGCLIMVVVTAGIGIQFYLDEASKAEPATSYRGIVVNQVDNLPIANATVRLLAVDNCTVTTGADGIFDFGFCDASQIARLKNPSATVTLTDGTRCQPTALLPPPEVTTIGVHSGEAECGLFIRAKHVHSGLSGPATN